MSDPDARAHVERAVAAVEAGDREAAMVEAETALQLDARCYQAHLLLGNLHQDRGALAEAIDCYERAIRLELDNPTAYKCVGNVLLKVEQFEDAARWFEKALQRAPDYHLARNGLGLALLGMGRVDEGLAHFHETLRACPDDPLTLYHVGSALGSRFQYDAAMDYLLRSLRGAPDQADVHVNLAVVANGARRFDTARHHYREAVRLAPDHALAHHAYGMFLLRMGEMAAGWEEYRWYDRLSRGPQRTFPTPEWSGEALAGRSLLIYAQQGYGDCVQFFRYLRQLRGGRVIYEADAPLVRLLRTSGGADEVIEKGSLPAGRAFDFHLPDLALPRVMGTTLSSVPATVPYLMADSSDVERWAAALAGEPGFRVGLVWAGNPRHRRDASRSLAPGELSGLVRVPGVRWISLQRGPAAAQMVAAPAGMRLVDLSERLHDFAETAAVMANLDLVITVDTAASHLAGALGREVWLLLPHDSDWRWLVDREDSPWYPTMRIFRQRRPFDWSEVADRVAAALMRRVTRPVVSSG